MQLTAFGLHIISNGTQSGENSAAILLAQNKLKVHESLFVV
jgi:hypothetical protein